MQYTTKEELLKLGEIDTEFAALLSKLNMPVLDYSNLGQFREITEKRTAASIDALCPSPPDIKQADHQVPIYDGSTVRARVYQPVPPQKAGSPLIVMYHGGGFCIGSPQSEERSCRNFVQALGAVCINAAYQLGPKHPFPAAPKSAWDTLKWAAANAKSFGADPSLGFVVGGTSSGGTLTAVLTHLARDEKLWPPLTGQYLAIPLLVTPAVVPEKYKKSYLSYEQNKNAPILPQAALDMFTRAYQPDENDPLYTPFNHPKGHADLPPAYFQVCGLDPLRDDALIYERVLREEYGIETKLDVYPGLPHGFGASFPMLKSADKFRGDMVEGMGWLLGRKPEMDKIRNSGNNLLDSRSKM